MKISLSTRLISIMVLSILLSSLITIFLVSSFTMKKVQGYSNQRDRDIALTMAEALSRAADDEQLEMAIRSLGNQRSRTGHEMMGPMMDQMQPGQGGRRRERAMTAPVLMFSAGDEVIPLLIVDTEGQILQGQSPDLQGIPHTSLPKERLELGAPFYSQGNLAGYVLTGRQAGIGDEEVQYFRSIFRGILIYPSFAALLASLLGALLLGRALKPLKSLYKGVVTIRKGEYGFRVELPPRRKIFNNDDELTRLSEGFNEMAATLEASEEWKKQIISDTAHELRTPVSLIMGNLEMIIDGVYQADKPRLKSLYRESQVLAELIRNLQVLASEESRQNTMEKEDFSLTQMVHQSFDDFRALAEKEHITLLDEAIDDCWITGDRSRSRQVLKNLIVNALRYCPPHGIITLRCRREGESILLEVEDTGPGIPESLRKRVFDRFFKIDSSRSSEGSGLGLSISKVLVENQGGSICVLEGSSGGALFQICFPQTSNQWNRQEFTVSKDDSE
ncbi:HAMP domain-containing sensor histidine kinase [Oceanispirochaeta sp.]|uniref:sensor histidine kinase n=1 Tax=Oceanispirochaeta sp. TaxID=2035350 RepID=UPI00263664DA|nr:HAMP domain-containing sensor histidine kinase [Oceanispirochaeta sp.]MDA3958332.1 HAMP domain-containing sensor histidine kinase [Oceanispirochaeta sp.]